jgi:hypothetical protein
VTCCASAAASNCARERASERASETRTRNQRLTRKLFGAPKLDEFSWEVRARACCRCASFVFLCSASTPRGGGSDCATPAGQRRARRLPLPSRPEPLRAPPAAAAPPAAPPRARRRRPPAAPQQRRRPPARRRRLAAARAAAAPTPPAAPRNAPGPRRGPTCAPADTRAHHTASG